jgi:APA family basic amino acid/polyamine antiporter
MLSETSGQLRRVLGVGFGLAVSIGGTIGVGILRTPGLVAQQLHEPLLILLLWVAGGIYTLLGASCLTELGLMLPRAGGFYVYVRRAFGNTAGFAVGWTDWLMYCSILGYLSIAIAEFIAALGLIPGSTIRFLSVLILVSIVALQWLGIRISSLFQEVTTSLKCVAFFGPCCGLPFCANRRIPIGTHPIIDDIQRVGYCLAGDCHHIRRLAKPLIFHRGRSGPCA